MIEKIIELVTTNQIVMIILVVIGVIALLSLLKKLFKFAALLILVILGIIAYVYLTSDNPREQLDQIIDKSKETVIKAKDKAEDLSKDLLKKVTDTENNESIDDEDSSSKKAEKEP